MWKSLGSWAKVPGCHDRAKKSYRKLDKQVFWEKLNTEEKANVFKRQKDYNFLNLSWEYALSITWP